MQWQAGSRNVRPAPASAEDLRSEQAGQAVQVNLDQKTWTRKSDPEGYVRQYLVQVWSFQELQPDYFRDEAAVYCQLVIE